MKMCGVVAAAAASQAGSHARCCCPACRVQQNGGLISNHEVAQVGGAFARECSNPPWRSHPCRLAAALLARCSKTGVQTRKQGSTREQQHLRRR